MNKLIKQVEQWSIDRELDKAESSKQMLKVVEEVGEVAAALARGQEEELKDGIGDVIVTLIILAQQNNTNIYECLSLAYSEISERKGKIIDGVFVKSEDLPTEFQTTHTTKFRLQAPPILKIYPKN